MNLNRYAPPLIRPDPRVHVTMVYAVNCLELTMLICAFCRAGKPTKGATCGGQKVGDTSFEVGGKFAMRKIVATYKSGATIKTTIQITVNHWCVSQQWHTWSMSAHEVHST